MGRFNKNGKLYLSSKPKKRKGKHLLEYRKKKKMEKENKDSNLDTSSTETEILTTEKKNKDSCLDTPFMETAILKSENENKNSCLDTPSTEILKTEKENKDSCLDTPSMETEVLKTEKENKDSCLDTPSMETEVLKTENENKNSCIDTPSMEIEILKTEKENKNSCVDTPSMETEVLKTENENKVSYLDTPSMEAEILKTGNKNEDSRHDTPSMGTEILQKLKNVSVIGGRRIVDLKFFIKQIQEISDHENAFCSFKDMDLVSEYKRGFNSGLKFKCRLCSCTKKIWSNRDADPNHKTSVNAAAVAAILEIGCGFTKLKRFSTALNIPCLGHNTFMRESQKIKKKEHLSEMNKNAKKSFVSAIVDNQTEMNKSFKGRDVSTLVDYQTKMNKYAVTETQVAFEGNGNANESPISAKVNIHRAEMNKNTNATESPMCAIAVDIHHAEMNKNTDKEKEIASMKGNEEAKGNLRSVAEIDRYYAQKDSDPDDPDSVTQIAFTNNEDPKGSSVSAVEEKHPGEINTNNHTEKQIASTKGNGEPKGSPMNVAVIDRYHAQKDSGPDEPDSVTPIFKGNGNPRGSPISAAVVDKYQAEMNKNADTEKQKTLKKGNRNVKRKPMSAIIAERICKASRENESQSLSGVSSNGQPEAALNTRSGSDSLPDSISMTKTVTPSDNFIELDSVSTRRPHPAQPTHKDVLSELNYLTNLVNPSDMVPQWCHNMALWPNRGSWPTLTTPQLTIHELNSMMRPVMSSDMMRPVTSSDMIRPVASLELMRLVASSGSMRPVLPSDMMRPFEPSIMMRPVTSSNRFVQRYPVTFSQYPYVRLGNGEVYPRPTRVPCPTQSRSQVTLPVQNSVMRPITPSDMMRHVTSSNRFVELYPPTFFQYPCEGLACGEVYSGPTQVPCPTQSIPQVNLPVENSMMSVTPPDQVIELDQGPTTAPEPTQIEPEVILTQPDSEMRPVTPSDMLVELDPRPTPSPRQSQETPDVITPVILDYSSMEQDILKAMTCEIYPTQSPTPNFLSKIKREETNHTVYKQNICSPTVVQQINSSSSTSTSSSLSKNQNISLFHPPALIKEEPVCFEELQ